MKSGSKREKLEQLIAVFRDVVLDDSPEKRARRTYIEQQRARTQDLQTKGVDKKARLQELQDLMPQLARELEAALSRNSALSVEHIELLPKWREFLQQKHGLLYNFPTWLCLTETSYVASEYKILYPPGTPPLPEVHLQGRQVRILVPPFMDGSRIVVRGMAQLLENTR